MARGTVDNSLTIHRSQSTPDFFAPLSDPSSDIAVTSLPSLPAFQSTSIEIEFADSGFDSSALSFDVADLIRKETASASTKNGASPRQQSPARTRLHSPSRESSATNTNPEPSTEKVKEQEQSKHPRTRATSDRTRLRMGFRSTPDVRDRLREDVKPISREDYYKVKAASRAALRSQHGQQRPEGRSVANSLASLSLRSRTPSLPLPLPSPPRGRQLARSRPRSSSVANLNTMAPTSTITTVRLSQAATASKPAPVEVTTTLTTTSTPTKPSDSTLSWARAFFLRRQQTLARAGTTDTDDSDSCASSHDSLTQSTVDSRVSQPSSEKSDTSATSDQTSASSATTDMLPTTPKDPLCKAFKSLESDFARLEGKTTHMRMIVIRNSLLPFLKQYAYHPSNRGITAVSLESRAILLEKWWNALLDMLDGRSTGRVAGVDRPQLLETLSMLMLRPEWRQSATYFLPLAERSSHECLKAGAVSWPDGSDNSSLDCLESSGSEFAAETAFHNVRSMFITALVRQMVIVVDKVSARNTPASLLNFAGKACAYAFVFAPGVAEVLVRLWGLSSDSIRRVADEFKLPHCSRGDDSESIASRFPLALQSLAWTSVKVTSDSLRQPAKPPLQVAKVNWYGPWVPKWKGQETDLFYIFTKYFYLLAQEFMPSGLPITEKARAPGFVILHAHILSLLDNTIHRQLAAEAVLGPPFGDSAQGVDASVIPIAPFGSNSLKGMGENRMIVLLRDFLSDHSATGSEPRQALAEAFMCLITAATKRISQYDYNACFTLCDFLEEALTAYSTLEMHQYDTGRLINWPFWLDVFRRIMDNQNIMSEIRVLSFVFTVWNIIALSPAVKESICRDWLLSEDVFCRLFTHWSPMVRAYFMRLLCWRICRDPGQANEVDARIFVLASSRVKTVWSHYLWLKQRAEAEGRYPPSTGPCSPTPGKKFMIIRTELPPSPIPGTVPPGFDSFSGPLTIPRGLGPCLHSGDVCSTTSPECVGSDDLPSAGKKRWALLSKILTLSNNIPSNRMVDEADAVCRGRRPDRAPSPPAGPPPPPRPSYARPVLSESTPSPSASSSLSASSSPVVCDNSKYDFRFVLSWHSPIATPTRERVLCTPCLPGPAQARINALEGSEPPKAAGIPPATRLYSGAAISGLVAEARNADPTAEIPDPSPESPCFSMQSGFSGRPSFARSSNSSVESLCGYYSERSQPRSEDISRKPPRTEMISRAKYSGRALAEWALIVIECNSFIDRRRNEGVFSLGAVEVPSLGVEGFRRSA